MVPFYRYSANPAAAILPLEAVDQDFLALYSRFSETLNGGVWRIVD